MKPLNVALKRQPIVYVTRDLERALSAPKTLKNYFIITNATSFAKKQAATQKRIFLIKSKKGLANTQELLSNPLTRKFLNTLQNPKILVFKNTLQIEKICDREKYQLINPPAKLASTVEEKVSQIAWLGPLAKLLVPHSVNILKNIQWRGEKFIIQFNHAHSGNGTLLITSLAELRNLQKNFPNRTVRVTKFINGIVFTNNNVVWDKKILNGNINFQITGLPPFTTRPFATIGNDWGVVANLLSKKQIRTYFSMAQKIGKKMAAAGWRGLFGIDVIAEQKTGKLYLLEINARQPASTTYESQLQLKKEKKKKNINNMTTFEAHISALLKLPCKQQQLITVRDGAQIIQKVNQKKETLDKKQLRKMINLLEKNNFSIINYDNTELESDWLRIQSTGSIMKDSNQFNEHGEKIKKILTQL